MVGYTIDRRHRRHTVGMVGYTLDQVHKGLTYVGDQDATENMHMYVL